MARNCPSYKTLYQETNAENRDLKRKLRAAEQRLEHQDRFIDSVDDDDDDEVTITARAREIQDPRLDLEGRAVLLVWL